MTEIEWEDSPEALEMREQMERDHVDDEQRELASISVSPTPAPRPEGWLEGEIALTAFALAHPDCDVRAVLQGFADWILKAPTPAWEPPLEFCICAAVKTTDGRIIRGHRHDGAMQTAWNMKLTLVPYTEDQQGFVTSKGRYVNREEAAALQRAAGIKTVDPTRIDFPDELLSEDLY